MRIHVFILAGLLVGCGGGSSSGSAPPPGSTPPPSPPPPPVYQPLAVGDSWTYSCNHSFTIQNSVTGTSTVNGQTVYQLAIQIPSSPASIATQTQLLATDAQGNVSIYGYLVNGSVMPVTPTVIVAAHPVLNAAYDYPALGGGTVSRTFVGFENSNPTPYGGVFTVAPYFESNSTHNYGYALNIGVVEEDHGPNFQFDCVLTAATLH
jgi:hypothetical protein